MQKLLFLIIILSSPILLNAQEVASSGGGGFGSLIPFILIFVIFYFFLIRPQNKKLQAHREMVNNVEKGDVIITSGGIEAIIIEAEAGNDYIFAEIAENIQVKILRSTVHQVVKKAEEIKAEKKEKRKSGSSATKKKK